MRRTVVAAIAVACILMLSLPLVSASFSIEKNRPVYFNFRITINGNDYQKAQRDSGAAWDYGYRAGDWVVNNYFRGLSDSSKIASMASQLLGIPIPAGTAAKLAIQMIKNGIAYKTQDCIRSTPGMANGVWIDVSSPPFPATWTVHGY